MALRLADFETLVWIARLGSFTATADRLRVSQSAVTRRVHELELQLGVTLFERSGRQADLTDQGHICLHYASQFGGLAARMRRDLGRTERLTGHVRVGSGEMTALWWLPQFLLRSSRLFPGIELEVNVDLSEHHIQRFEQGTLDFLLLPGEPPQNGKHLLLDRIQYNWMASPRFGLPNRPLSPVELAQWPLISLSDKSNNHIAIMKWFRMAGVKPNRMDACNSLTVVANLVSAGMGIALLPTPIFLDRIASGQLKIVTTNPPLAPIPIWVVHREDETLPLADLAEIAADVHHLAAGTGAHPL